jgi:hypothetical protein
MEATNAEALAASISSHGGVAGLNIMMMTNLQRDKHDLGAPPTFEGITNIGNVNFHPNGSFTWRRSDGIGEGVTVEKAQLDKLQTDWKPLAAPPKFHYPAVQSFHGDGGMDTYTTSAGAEAEEAGGNGEASSKASCSGCSNSPSWASNPGTECCSSSVSRHVGSADGDADDTGVMEGS